MLMVLAVWVALESTKVVTKVPQLRLGLLLPDRLALTGKLVLVPSYPITILVETDPPAATER